MPKNGLIKSFLIAANVITCLVVPWPKEIDDVYPFPVIPVPIIFLCLLVPIYFLAIRKESSEKLYWPEWSTSLFNPTGVLFGNFDFFGMYFLTGGIAMMVNFAMNNNELSRVGLMSISTGGGVLCGVMLTIFLGKRVNHN